MEVSLTRNTYFPKHAFFVSGSFLSSFWTGEWFQNHSKMLPEINQKSILFSHPNKNTKNEPPERVHRGPTNQLFAPKIPSGTLGHPRRRQSASGGSPGRFLIDFSSDFMIFHGLCINDSSIFVVFCIKI